MVNEGDISRLLHDLGSRYAIPRRKAVEALVEIGAPAVPGLTASLAAKHPDAQQAAADALERIGTPEALAAVRRWRQLTGHTQS